MELGDHGGGCCGINHIYRFGPRPDQGYINTFRRLIERFDGSGGGHRVLEAALTDSQCDSGWRQTLINNDFVPVCRFRNSNSGNFVTIFHRYRERLLVGHEYTIERFGEPQMIAPPPSEVLCEYFADLRTVGRRGPYPSIELARLAFPRASNFSVRTIFSDGEIVESPVA